MPLPSGFATIALLAASTQVVPAAAATAPSRAFDVLGYTATLRPDVVAGTLTGIESIELVVTGTGATQLQFDVGGITIDSVTLRADPLPFNVANRQLTVTLPAAARPGRRLELEIRYRAAPRHGLQFHPDVAQLYTVFSTSEWLVAIDAPEERAMLDLSVVLPEDYRAVGNGPVVSRKAAGKGQVVYRWRQREPIPSFAYGFAAGRFNEVASESRGFRSRFLSRTLTDAQARKLFGNTGDMLEFFARRSGVPYRGKYDQVLVKETIGQEVASYALLSEAYGEATLAGSSTEELIAHEVAHQWWGIGTTCRTWGDFWLNEGFANFMAGAYMQHRHGDGQYQTAVSRWKARLDKLRSDGKDRALVYARWDKPTRDDRAVVYQKGAYVLHLLREELGEAAFWKGIRDYSRQFARSSVVTADFQHAMERSSGRDLDGFFARWVRTGSGK